MSSAEIERGYKLMSRLAQVDLPPMGGYPVQDADDLLRAYVGGCDNAGRYYANAMLLRRLFWWQDTQPEPVRIWRDELIDRGDLEIRPTGRSCYTGDVIMVAYLMRPGRYQRFSLRVPIPARVRGLVYRRDGYRCVRCQTTDNLSLDHIHPWSLGGSDEPGNLQTMCRPCNSSKGARLA